MNNVIEIKGLTKDYGLGRGLFDINLSVREGEVFGLVGINGAGKTTMIRHLMGFLHSDSGKCSVMGMDCWSKSAEIKNAVGYIPGEISFPDVKSGIDFFKLQAEYMGMSGISRANELAERFNLDATARLKRMSKGMKQKSAIVNAFMSDSKVLLFDEGTTGLDPLMQKVFTDLVREEKLRGKTVFMSSHMFDELESVCDRVAFLKEGRIIDIIELSKIRGNERIKEYKIEFVNAEDYTSFLGHSFSVKRRQDEYRQVTINIPDDDINELFRVLSAFKVKYITQKPQTLETYFLEKYQRDAVTNTEVSQ
ncbi:MAG: ABC transporter ATP-binding protein [Oscillospiraceae bacterium]|jgi:ABC-2 type transport system ATP-binding protein|nr:ABC transporter ATP-binding protein [Oscillospiraceae bacterium]